VKRLAVNNEVNKGINSAVNDGVIGLVDAGGNEAEPRVQCVPRQEPGNEKSARGQEKDYQFISRMVDGTCVKRVAVNNAVNSCVKNGVNNAVNFDICQIRR